MLNLPLMVIGLATIVVSGWSYYHGRRFAGRERRRAPGRVMGEALAHHFGVHPADLTRWQSARRLLVRHDTRGLVVGVESELGVDKVDRRPPDYADPLPWIEGLVVDREDITEPVSRRAQITRQVIAPPATRVFESDYDEVSRGNVRASMAGAAPAPAVHNKASAPSCNKAVSGTFDPALLADLGLFDPESNTNSSATQGPPDSDASALRAFQHEGRVYYI